MFMKPVVADIARRLLRRWDLHLVRGADLWRPMAQLEKQPPPLSSQPDRLRQNPFLLSSYGASVQALQAPFDFAVVMPTILRPTITDAIASVFDQDFVGRIQLIIGVDRPGGELRLVQQACQHIPPRHAVQVFYPGYSTSRRYGGLHPAWDGGVLRTVLSYLANSRYVAYLDDDNWFAPNHLSSLHAAIQGQDWAYTRRWFVHPRSRQPICEDLWESIGPLPQGTAVDPKGWVDPNCLALDKLACEAVLRWWSIPLRYTSRAMDADRNVFEILQSEFHGRATNQASVYYSMDEADEFRHPFRLAKIGADRYASAGAATALDYAVPASHRTAL